MARRYARTFGQDLMRGEHVVGEGSTRAGVLGGGATDTYRNTQFYREKTAAEATHGPLTNAEFRALNGSGGKMDGATKGSPAGLTIGLIENMEGATSSGTSIFDPVLCEIAYRWFCPPGGTVLDPFAGGSVRGIVASRLGLPYIGIELRAEQVEANGEQISLATGPEPRWIAGDSRDVAQLAGDVDADLLFSCPPYWNLERYSDDPADLSTLGKAEFFEAYARIIAGSVARLRPDRFAVWIIGDVRDKEGFFVNLPGKTVEAFEAAGAGFYNDAILVTALGSLPIRAGRQFAASRKLGRTHQNVLVFCKGDPKKATDAIGPCEFGEVEPSEDDGDEAPPE